MTVRNPTQEDAPLITQIDTDGLATGHATFRDTPHDWESFQKDFLTQGGLALVALDGTEIVGWAGVSAMSARDVYRGVGEVSVYVCREKQGRGVGRRLLTELILTSEDHGYWTLVAQIFKENEASLSLHESLGFVRLGIRRKLGKMTYGPFVGRWRDVVMLERRSLTVGLG